MDYFFSILLCIIFIVIAGVSIIYSGMDKQKMRATLYAKQMIAPLDDWVRHVVEQTKSPGFDADMKDKLQALESAYFGTKKLRDPLKTIMNVNSIIEQLEKLDGADPSKTITVAPGYSDLEFNMLFTLQSGYNGCVDNLNKRLDKPVTAYVAKLTRMKKLDELMSLVHVPELDETLAISEAVD